MKSAEKYPEYQGEPGNIQFLTRAEHLEAHDGSWQNPTNWYFNPVTKEKLDFGDGPFIPCEIIRLKEPVVSVADLETCSDHEDIEAPSPSDKEKNTSEQSFESNNQTQKKAKLPISHEEQIPKKTSNVFINGLKSAGRFIVNHPVESLEIAGVVIGGAATLISSVKGRSSKGTVTQTPSSSTNASSIADKVVDIVEKANRALPSENDVSGHKQR